jgi:multidrug efflux pump subunit AcrA (membrane-fusion protein)
MRVPCAILFASVAGVVLGCEKQEVTVAVVDRGAVESTVTSVEAGVVEPLHKASLASPVSGRIVRVHHLEGDRVRAGEPLVELENALERLGVEEKARELERLKQIKDDVTPAEQLDRADFAHRRAVVDYERTIIRATFDGIVADVNARVGEMTFGSMALALGVGKGSQDQLIYVVDDSKLFVKAEIDESDVFRVKPGQPVKVTLGGLDRSTIKATVVSISPVVSTREGESRTAEVKAEIQKEDCEAPGDGAGRIREGELPERDRRSFVLVGMSADIEVLVGRVEDVVRVPTTAILERGDEKHVFVVRGGKLARQPITAGLGNWDMTEVRSGLLPGDQVVLPTDVKVLVDGREVTAVTETYRPVTR